MPNLSTKTVRWLGAALAAATVASPLLLWALAPAELAAAVGLVALAVPFLTMTLLDAATPGDGCTP